jgi:PAS domain S-box-containing protein
MQTAVARYSFGVAAVVVALVLKIVLTQLTGRGATFVLFFAAMLVTSLFAGSGPTIMALAVSFPLAAAMFLTRPGNSTSHAIFQALLYAGNGLLIVYLAVLTDRRRRRMQETIELSPDAYFLADIDAHFTDVNEAACRLLGYERDELIGKSIFDIVPPEDAARLKAVREELMGPHQVHKAEWALRRKDETMVPVEVSTNILPGGRWQAFIRDISYRKTVEAALKRAVSTRDDVLSIVAHDLRNPLSTIIAQTSMLERAEPEFERRDSKPRLVIMRSAKRMNDLIQDLLDVAVVEAGELKLTRERLSAADLARDVVEAQKPLAASSGLELRLETLGGVHDVWGDRNRLLRVFDNLIGNALKFTKEGGHVMVRVAARDQEIVFSVADTGAGIPAESLAHVFDRFWQAAGRASRLGAGLGLPITRGIVEAHGGRIWAESTIGQGSTFFFTIPILPALSGPPMPAGLTKQRANLQSGARR